MKALYFVLALALLSMTFSRDCDYGEAKTAKECNEANFDKTQFHRCCFVDSRGTLNGEEKIVKNCVPLPKQDFDNIKDTVKKLEKNMEEENIKSPKVSIDCKSNYIALSILSLIIFLL